MNLADLADIAGLLAALGVIASLVYVGFQASQTQKAVRAATAQARTDLGVARAAAYWIRNYAWAAEEWANVQMTMPPDFAAFINTELERHP